MTDKKQIKIAAFTSRQDDPASYFRVRQYKERLEQESFSIQEFSHPVTGRCWYPFFFKATPYISAVIKCRNSDVVWLRRILVEGYETFERLLKRPRVMDVDDAIWLARPFGKYAVPHIARGMDAIIAGNNYLANWFDKYCKQIHVVPTAIDTVRYTKKIRKTDNDEFVVGWTGTSSNFFYLNSIEKPLAHFLADHKDSCFKIIADKPWYSELIPPDQMRFVQWSRQVEVESLHTMSVGIMPLTDTPWARGKCSFKMLQYMAVGLPVIVSPIGMNKDVLSKADIGFAAKSDEEWYHTLETLYKDEQSRTKFGDAGRKVVEQFYSFNTVIPALASIFEAIVK
ncbi:MAG: glycosyltransferase [Sedimentisphaerales bacterium]|jgi:glycosyltransferase involved in cell wall biosynthesis